jgi:hypothetical protein
MHGSRLIPIRII